MKQFIFGGYSSLSVGSQSKGLVKSSSGSVADFAGDSDISRVGSILCSFKSVPIAFWGVPTLNNMVFSRRLWEMLLENQYLRRSLEDGSHFGEGFHANHDEVLYPNVACRVTNFWLADNNLVLGDVDILNTPNGVIVYTLAKISKVGISSRGFGELADIGNGLRDVAPEDYSHICWDMVAFPAVPDASMTLAAGENALPSKELSLMSDQLRRLVKDASDRHPEDVGLRSLWNSVKEAARKPYNVRNEVVSAMVAHRLRTGVTSLFSGKGRGRIKSSPDSYGYGGGPRDSVLEGRMRVFVSTLEIQVRRFSAKANVVVRFGRSAKGVSSLTSVSVVFPGGVLRGCLEVESVVGSGEYFLKVFSESYGKIKLAGFNFRLAVHVAALIGARL
jgi:hypothetical protein